MKISLALLWAGSKSARKAVFRSPGAGELFEFYVKRAQHHFPQIEIQPTTLSKLSNRPSSEALWLCERLKKSTAGIESSEVAEWLNEMKLNSAKKLWIVVGPPDGISKSELQMLKPERLWSFGACTLPHELASVVMAEQLYRALTILDQHPYHLGH